jgi:HAD superfamily hydrolase (TIGR01509 family)
MITQAPFIPAAVIFDMDGLMLDTERPMIEIWCQVAQSKGWDVIPEVVNRTIGINEAATKALLIDHYGPQFPYYEIRQEMVRLVVEKAEKEGIPHRPGLITLLDHLARLEIPLGVATSTNKDVAIWKLQQAHILERFRVFVFGDEVSRGKPAPDIFLLAAERLGKAPGDCVGFEDSPSGLQSLHAAGIRSVFIQDLVEPSPTILAHVWQRCADLAEAAALFG